MNTYTQALSDDKRTAHGDVIRVLLNRYHDWYHGRLEVASPTGFEPVLPP
jgi:hypothetical protein